MFTHSLWNSDFVLPRFRINYAIRQLTLSAIADVSYDKTFQKVQEAKKKIRKRMLVEQNNANCLVRGFQ